MELPQYKGSTLRGGFGSAFRQIVCREEILLCSDCIVKEVCPYALVFESMPPPGSDWKADTIPRPFVIEPPMTSKTSFKPNEELEFTIVLFGKAIPLLPYFIAAFRQLGRNGFGKGRRSFVLTEVCCLNESNEPGDVIYQDGGQIMNNPQIIYGRALLAHLPSTCSKIKVCFETMTRIREHQSLTIDLTFQTFFRTLVRRISALFAFYHTTPWEYDYRTMIEASSNIETESSDLQWVDWERYSQRQATSMKLGGFVGNIVFKGDLMPFLPVIWLGQYTHVGKVTTFGLGKYQVEV